MNNFLECLKNNNLLDTFIKDQCDINFLSLLNDIVIEEKESKQGKIFKKKYFNWFAIINNEKHALNLSRSDLQYVKRELNTYCKSCGKFIGKKYISQIFEMKFSNEYEINDQCPCECKKCAATNNAIKGQDKSKQTCLKKYGVEYSFQSENNKQKSIKTKIEKYGENWKYIQASRMFRYSERDENGKLIYHNGYNPETRRKMVEGWKKTVANKPIEEIQKWRAKIIGKTTSKICTEFLNNLSNILNEKIQHEKAVGTKYIDGYIENKLLIEFYGNYWHCNPLMYNKDDKILQHKKLINVNDIWKSDSLRNQYILSIINLPLIIIWEQSYINNKNSVINEIKNNLEKGYYENGKIYII